MRPLAYGAFLALSPLVFSCGPNADDRPPLLDPCKDGMCGNAGSGGDGGTGGGAGEAGASATGVGGSVNAVGGSGGTPAQERLAGTLGSFETAALTGLTSYSGTGTLFAQKDGGGITEAAFDGNRYAFTDVRVGQGTWVQVVPDDTDYMSMIVSVDTTGTPLNVRLPVLRRSVLEDIYASVSEPIEVDPERGHLIMEFIDMSGAAAITVTSPATDQVIYSRGIGWDDNVQTTDLVGLVVLPNLVSGDFLDTYVAVDAMGGVTESFSFPIAADSVTYTRYLVGTP